MQTILIAFAIGLTAAAIDVVPMIIQKLEKSACISAAVHWIVLGFIIPFLNWGLAPWLTGMLAALLASVPIMVLVFEKDRKAIIPITVFSLALGAGVGCSGAYFIG